MRFIKGKWFFISIHLIKLILTYIFNKNVLGVIYILQLHKLQTKIVEYHFSGNYDKILKKMAEKSVKYVLRHVWLSLMWFSVVQVKKYFSLWLE